MPYKRVIIQKPDLDTCLTALIMGVSETDDIVISKTNASPDELADPSILCIEAGGSGQVHLNNFDHHDINTYYPPACRQAYNKFPIDDNKLLRLVDYVSMVDERATFDHIARFPSLSNIFSGMLLVENDTKKQFLKGIDILKTLLQKNIDPFDTMPELPEWEVYKKAKIENQKLLQEAIKDIKIYKTKSGLTLGFLQTNAVGGLDAIYDKGCEVALLYNPRFNNSPIPKYTVASKGVAIGHLLSILNSVEQGWGGRATIFGSPREGTSITPSDLINILIENL